MTGFRKEDREQSLRESWDRVLDDQHAKIRALQARVLALESELTVLLHILRAARAMLGNRLWDELLKCISREEIRIMQNRVEAYEARLVLEPYKSEEEIRP